VRSVTPDDTARHLLTLVDGRRSVDTLVDDFNAALEGSKPDEMALAPATRHVEQELRFERVGPGIPVRKGRSLRERSAARKFDSNSRGSTPSAAITIITIGSDKISARVASWHSRIASSSGRKKDRGRCSRLPLPINRQDAGDMRQQKVRAPRRKPQEGHRSAAVRIRFDPRSRGCRERQV
jgi:hypothetical protein